MAEPRPPADPLADPLSNPPADPLSDPLADPVAEPGAVAPPPENLTSQTVRGIQWTYISTASAGILQLASAAVLGRLLTPAAFGLVAMALLALQFTNTFARMGVGPALIQKRELSPEEVRAGFTASLGLGAAVAGVVWFAAPVAATAFTEPDLVPVLRAMGLTLVLHGMGLPADSLLRRQLRFRERELLRVLSYAVGYTAFGTILALMGAGVWSLVGANLVQTTMTSVLHYSRVRHSLKPIFRWSAYHDLLGFGSRVSLISILEYIGHNLDTFAVGRYASAALLGQYNRAFVLVGVPIRQLNHGLSNVLFPSLSKLQSDVIRLRRTYLFGVSASAAILLPLCAGMAVAAREIVLVVFGSRWEPVIVILPFIALASSFGTLTHFAAIVTEAQAELNKKMALQSTYLLILALFLVPAIGKGLWAYAAAYASAKVFQHVGYILLLRHTLGLQLLEYGRIYLRSLLSAGITAGVIFLGQRAMSAVGAPLPVILVVEVALGALTLLALFRFGTLKATARQFRELLHKAGIPRASVAGRVAKLAFGPY